MLPQSVKIEGFIHLTPWDAWYFAPFEDMSEQGFVLLRPWTIETEVPYNFDPTSARIASLEKKRKALQDKFIEENAKIAEEIKKLQAIGFQPRGQIIDPDMPF